MARTIQSRPLIDFSSLARRARNMLRTVFTRGDFSTLIITCALMVVPVAALSSSLDFSKDFVNQSATWRVSLSQLIPVAILAVIFGFLLSRSHYSELFSLILSAIYCVAIVIAIQFFLAPGNPVQRVLAILTRLSDSLTISMSRNTLDPYLLVIFLSILVWFLGYNTAWHTFRLDRVWRAVLPPGIVLALDGFYNFETTNIDAYLIIYVFLSLLLIIRSHIEAREFDWYMNRVNFQGNLRSWFFRSGAVLGLIMLVLAWVLPTGSPEENAKRFQEFLSGDVASKVTQLLNKLFGSLQGTGVATADYYGGDTLALGGTIQLGDGPVLVVKAPSGPRYYWKSRVFDTYEDNKWSSPRSLQITSPTAPYDILYPPTDPTTRKDVQQTITMVVGTSGLLYAAPQPVRFEDVPVQIDMDWVDQTAKTINPSVTRQLTHLDEGQSYTVTSSISVATADYLRKAPTNYPDWVKQLDLQYPSTITARTKQLAQEIVQNAKATTEYDKAKAIEQWLRNYIHYNEALPEPPADKELVDWMLFDLKQAYCTYYASAMIVMLRTQGIPARMAAGFAQGLYDPATQSYVVREHDAHTWVEVYFVGAGWVEFEPTAAQQSLERIDPNVKPTATALASPTPTPSPTQPPPPSSTPPPNRNAAATQPPPSQQPQVTQTLTPSPTLTLTPSPTPGPPLRLLQLPPPVQNAISVLLAVSIFIAVMSFAVVGALWWIEYRGLDRYSPVGRAYARLALYARWLGVPFGESNTPLERGRRIARSVPQGSRPVTTITDMYIAERYARPRDLTPGEEEAAAQAWRRARRSLIARKIRQWLRRE